MNDFNPLYYDEPEKFNPDRWKEGKSKIGTGDTYHFIPFGSGPRNCIGQHLSWIEAKIIFSEFLKRFGSGKLSDNYTLKMTYRLVYEPLEELLYDFERK